MFVNTERHSDHCTRVVPGIKKRREREPLRRKWHSRVVLTSSRKQP